MKELTNEQIDSIVGGNSSQNLAAGVAGTLTAGSVAVAGAQIGGKIGGIAGPIGIGVGVVLGAVAGTFVFLANKA